MYFFQQQDVDACKSMHALNCTNQTESFQGKLIFFGGGVRFWCLVSRNFWSSLMLLHKQFWWNKTVSSCCNMLLVVLRQTIIVLLVFFPVLRLSSYSIVLIVHKDCVSQRNLNSTFSYFHVNVFVYLPTLLSWLV